MEVEARVDPSHVDRIRKALRKHRDSPEVAEVLAAIDDAHEHAHRALERDENASLEYSNLAWARTALLPWPDALPAHAQRDLAQSARRQKPLPSRAETHVTKSGALAGFGKYEEFDTGWLETLAEYLEHIGRPKPDFGENPQCIEIDERASLAIAGDWATGYWNGAETPAARIAAQMREADYTLHLGDTYYAGTQHQVNEHLEALWPRGKRDAFVVPGNHEMYTKGQPLMAAIRERLPSQQGTSFFALRNAHWLVLALDTAYFATHMYLHGTLGPETYRRRGLGGERVNEQLAFARKLLDERGARRVMLFTHHPPFELLGPSAARPLRDEVRSLLPGGPDYWAWGHFHASAVYAGSEGVPRGRLIGAGAIPYGSARELAKLPEVRWFETKRADDAGSERVLNGFLRLDLDGPNAREALIAENGETRWSGELGAASGAGRTAT